MGWNRRLAGTALAALGAAAGCAHLHLGPRSAYDDAALTTAVRARFATDDAVSAMDVRVRTTGGAVRLSGLATDPAAAGRAVRLARAVTGVKEVENDIRLVPNT